MDIMALTMVVVGKQASSSYHAWKSEGNNNSSPKHIISSSNTMNKSSGHHKIPWMGEQVVIKSLEKVLKPT